MSGRNDIFTLLSGGASRHRRRFHSCARSPTGHSCARSRRSRSPSGGRRFALRGGVFKSLSHIKTTLSHQGPRLEGRRPPQAFKESFLRLACSVDLKPGDCEMVVDGGRALQPCRYRLFTHMLQRTHVIHTRDTLLNVGTVT